MTKLSDMYNKELMGLSHIKEANIKLISIRPGALQLPARHQRGRAREASAVHQEQQHPTRWFRSKTRNRCSSRIAPRSCSRGSKRPGPSTTPRWTARWDSPPSSRCRLAVRTWSAPLDMVRQHADARSMRMMSELTQQKETRAKQALEETGSGRPSVQSQLDHRGARHWRDHRHRAGARHQPRCDSSARRRRGRRPIGFRRATSRLPSIRIPGKSRTTCSARCATW